MQKPSPEDWKKLRDIFFPFIPMARIAQTFIRGIANLLRGRPFLGLALPSGPLSPVLQGGDVRPRRIAPNKELA